MVYVEVYVASCNGFGYYDICCVAFAVILLLSYVACDVSYREGYKAHSGELDISFSSLMQDVMDKTATATATILQMVCFICLFVISTIYNTLYKKIVQNYELFFHLRKHSIFLTVFHT